MTTTTPRSRTLQPHSSVDLPGQDVPVVSLSAPTRRRPSWVAAGVVLIGVAALLGAYVFASISETTRIIVAARDLDPGAVISAADLRVVEVGGTPAFRWISPDEQSVIIGTSPRSPIPESTALNTSLFIDSASAIPDGKVVVGGAFEAGEVPTPSLAVGERVQLFRVQGAAPGAEVPQAAAAIGEAVIWSLDGQAIAGVASELVWVSMLVDRSIAADVVQAVGNDQLRLVLVTPQ